MCPLMSNLAPTSAAERYFLASKPEVFETQAKSLSVSFDASGPDTFLFLCSVIYIVHSSISSSESTFYGRLQATVSKSSAIRKYNRLYGQVAGKAVGEAPN